ncbi:unknown [Firmicutes bacterium CAG:475]|nr:unknown [Firmicutes bacterium CAG:475]
MKKLSIRSLLIVVLALVLVFALVACGNKDDNKGGNTGGGGGGQTTPANDVTNVKNYFNTLWEKSTGIGGEAIGEKDDLKVSLDLAVALDLVDGNGQGYDTLDLGIALELVLDRSSAEGNSTNTAIKAKFYDPSNGENWFTAYYFFNDVDNIYIDYAGQNVKIPFSYLNDTYNKNFYNFIFNDKPVKGKSIAEVVTALTKNMGSSWDLNVLIGDVMKVFDVDVAKFKDTISGVLGMLDGFNVDDAFDAQGNLNIKSILTNDMIAGFFANDETTTVTKGDVTTYTTKLASSTLDMLSLFGDNLPAGLMDVIEGLDLTLQFTTKNDAIDSFTIKVGLPALEGENANVNNVYPVVAITINELDFAKASKGEIENSMAVERDNYTTEAVIDAEVAVDLKGITLNALAFDKEGYARFSKVNTAIGGGLDNLVLDGNLALSLSGKLDLKNKENNGTVAKAALTYKGVNIIEASFKDGTLAVKVNQEAKIGNVKILDTLVRLFGDYAYSFVKTTFFKGNAEDAALKAFATKFFGCDIEAELAKDPQERVVPLNESFKGAAWKNVDIVGGFQKLVKGVLDKMFPPKTNAGTAVAKDPIITKVADTVVAALPLIKSTNGKLVVATNANKAFKNAYSSVGNTVQTIGKIWWVKDAKPFTETLITNDKGGWLPVFANALKVAGTTYGDKADAEKVKTFLNEMFACTAEVTLDISEANGFELGVKADVNASAGVAVSVKLCAKAYDATQYTNLAPDVETDGWFVYTFAA